MGKFRFPAIALAISVALAAPCFWQPRIQAGDLSSHLYNAWLAILIEQGRAPGLTLSSQWTNALTSLVLPPLSRMAGFHAADRVLAAFGVLVFGWGALVLLRVVSRTWAWWVTPCVAMLAYGWVLHMGFLNYFISMGLCLWALALLWSDRGPAVKVLLLPVLGLAVLAHPFPAAGTIAVAVYAWLASRAGGNKVVFACSLAMIAASAAFVRTYFTTYSSVGQIFFLTGADQMWIFGTKYVAVALCLFLLWAIFAARLIKETGWLPLAKSVPFQVLCLTAAAIVLFPVAVHLPQYQHTFWYITDRMSLAAALSVCVVLGTVKPGRPLKVALGAVAAVYFCFLYLDSRALNRTEAGIEKALAALQPGDRVVSGLSLDSSRIDAVQHMIDRACIGRCFSYANYEPSTGQFPIRANRGNPVVLSEYREVYALQHGDYVVKARDLPLWRLGTCGTKFCLQPLREGERVSVEAITTH
jgi:hypothetical protein